MIELAKEKIRQRFGEDTVYLNSDSNSVMTAGIGGVPVPHWETEEERGNQQNESDK